MTSNEHLIYINSKRYKATEYDGIILLEEWIKGKWVLVHSRELKKKALDILSKKLCRDFSKPKTNEKYIIFTIEETWSKDVMSFNEIFNTEMSAIDRAKRLKDNGFKPVIIKGVII